MTHPRPDDFVEKSPAVFVAKSQPVTVDAGAIHWLKQSAASATKKRARICAHGSPADALHEMLIVLQADTYIRPHRHHGKCESMHAIEGRAALIYFTEKGEPKAIRFLGLGDGDCLFCRTEHATYHTVVVLTESFVFHETVQGPFQPNDTEFAPWAPTEEDGSAVLAYRKKLAELIEQCLPFDSALRSATL